MAADRCIKTTVYFRDVVHQKHPGIEPITPTLQPAHPFAADRMATTLFGGVAARIAIEANVLRECGGNEALEKLAEEELAQSCRVLEKARSAFFG